MGLGAGSWTVRRRRLLAAACGVLIALAAVSCEELPNVPPTAAFILSPVAPIIAGQTVVTFNASPSRDGDGQIASFVWNFGDGTAEVTAQSPVTNHVFPDTPARCVEVTYTVLLAVVDDKSERASASQQVTVIEAPAPTSAECQPPSR
jgi:hypothetical protein